MISNSSYHQYKSFLIDIISYHMAKKLLLVCQCNFLLMLIIKPIRTLIEFNYYFYYNNGKQKK